MDLSVVSSGRRANASRMSRKASRVVRDGKTTLVGDVEFALGETRWDESGERIGTFLCVAQIDGEGKMRRYMVARTPALEFSKDENARTA